jgi:predicted secreted Zn-dependent protease
MAVTAKKGSSSTRTYSVSGKSLDEIVKAMDKNGPKDPNDGSRYSGSCIGTLTIAIGAKDFAFAARKDSSPVEVTASFGSGGVGSSCVITLPALASDKGLSDAAKKEWTRFLAAVQTHEQGHVDAYFDEAKAIADELNKLAATGTGKDEKHARIAAAKALVALADKSFSVAKLSDRAKASAKAYDAKTKHGATQKAVLDGTIN